MCWASLVWQCLFQVEILIRCFATILRLKNQEKRCIYTWWRDGEAPDHATVVYAQQIKRLWPEMPVIIGGIEAVCADLRILIIGKIKFCFHLSRKQCRPFDIWYG